MEVSDDELDDLISEIADDLCNSDDTITGVIADTYATGWGLDEYGKPEITKVGSNKLIIKTQITVSGDHDDEKPFLGDTIVAHVSVTMTQSGESWEQSEYTLDAWELNFDDEEDEEEEGI